MILVGQYDSPFVRRVAISLRVLAIPYDHDTRSVFGDFDAMRTVNPLGRIPSLILDDGATLVDSSAILDWLDRNVGAERALIPAAGEERTQALQTLALATGGVETFGAANYEEMIRPSHLRWPEWKERRLIQGRGALAALERELWPETRFDQREITTGCLIGYLKLTRRDDIRDEDYPALNALWARCAAHEAFRATDVEGYAVPRGN